MAPAGPRTPLSGRRHAWGAEDLRIDYMSVEPDRRPSSGAGARPLVERPSPGFDDLLEQNGTGFLVGDSPHPADIAVWEIVDR
jgi:hypothetical protein